MEITEVRITLRNENRLKAFVTATFDKCFAVRNMKIVQGDNGLMLCMPSRKLLDGTYKDIAHPINAEFRAYLEKTIFEGYEKELKKAQSGQAPEQNNKGQAANTPLQQAEIRKV